MQQSLHVMFLGVAMLVSVAASAQERAVTERAGDANPPSLPASAESGNAPAQQLVASASMPVLKPGSVPDSKPAPELPDAPTPQNQAQPAQSQAPSSQTTANPAQSSSQQQPAGSAGTQQTDDQLKDQQKKQVQKQVHQRAFGIVPSFNTSMDSQAVVLTGWQKIDIALHTTVDPFTFGEAFVIGGYHELGDKESGFGWGAQGYFKRVGAEYLDYADGTIVGNGVLPAVLHQDPRFFRMGHGSILKRGLYVAATAFICKGDKSRKWQPNVSNVGGNIFAGYISTFYYPKGNSGWGQIIGDGMLNTFVGVGGTMFQEFWPDAQQHFAHKNDTNP